MDLQILKSQASIVDVVGRYRPLEKSGQNMKCLCPFHDDHKPSMIVNISQNFAWCFACQNGGDVFSFVQKIEGVDFPESVRIVGEISGLDTSFIENQDPQKAKEAKDEKQLLRELMADTQNFFLHQLSKTPKAQEYVSKTRRFTSKTQENFGIGYAPDSFDALEKHLLEKKYSRVQMIKAGVVSQKEGKESVYDKFRDRIMFPVHDSHGKIVGFGGRSLGEGEPKYLNSPETILYNKSSLLFGFHKAKEAMRKENMAVLVEGNLDVMTCHEFAIEHVVGISGTGFTEIQAKLIKRFCTRITLALDSDKAGMDATLRLIPTLFSHGFSVRVMDIPNAKDPDQALREDENMFIHHLQNANHAIEVISKRLINASSPKTVEEKKEILKKIFPLVLAQKDYVDKKESFVYISKSIGFTTDELEDLFYVYQRSASKFLSPPKEIKKPRLLEDHEFFWGLCFRYFGESESIFSRFTSDFFLDENQKQLYESMKHAYNEKRVFPLQDVEELMGADFIETVQKSSLLLEEKLGVLPKKQRREEIQRFGSQYGKQLLKNAIQTLSQKGFENPKNLESFYSLSTLLKQFH